MTAANQSIITAFEDLGMTPEEISADQEYDIAAVKAALMQGSSKFRKLCGKDEECGFSPSEEKRALEVIAQIAQFSEDDNCRLRAAIYIRQDKRGRLDAVKQMAGLNINVISMNEQMQKALKAINKSKGVVDIQEVKELVSTNGQSNT